MDGFQKKRVYEQAAEQLAQRIQSGDWAEKLPSERRLSSELGVSRDQVHAAILLLRQRGVIELSGKRNLISTEGVKKESKLKTVVLITPDSLQVASHGLLCILDQLRNKLSKQDVAVRLETTAALNHKSPSRSLERVVENYPNAVWVLHKASSSIQDWFAHSGLPSVVLGTAAESSQLDYVDLDHEAAARHAVGVVTRAGHLLENVMLLRPATKLEGLVKMEQGYREAVEASEQTAFVLTYRELETLGPKISQWLDRGVKLEALVVTSYKTASFLPGWLAAERGLIVGRDLSLICLSDGPALGLHYPSVAYYAMHSSGLSDKLVRLVRQKLKGVQSKKQRAIIVMPEFVAGTSVCACRH